MSRRGGRSAAGFTLTELLIAVAIGGVILAGLGGIVSQALATSAYVAERQRLEREAHDAMGRIVRVAAGSRLLLLPFADDPGTSWPEHRRSQTNPPSAPPGDSTFATAVLAVTLPAWVDLDGDGVPDADDDRDGRIDEDPGSDATHDLAPGVVGIDDDGDGSADDPALSNDDDDEDGAVDEDALDGNDSDADGTRDEDAAGDLDGDGCAGICGVDDDEDGFVDEGASDDDDEDSRRNEDPYDAVVYYLDGDELVERMPVPWDADGDGSVNGRDYVASALVGNVTLFRTERLRRLGGGRQLVEVTLELEGAEGAVVRVSSRVRIGGAP